MKKLLIAAIILALSIPAHAFSSSIPTCNSLEELQEHEATCDALPEKFVSYAPLKAFGTFGRYQYSYPIDQEGFYELNDANGHKICFHINYLGNDEIWRGEPLKMDNSVTDMRTHPSGLSGTVYSDGIDYIYSDGNLIRIAWEIGDIGFVLSLDRDKGPYPLNKEITPITRLLSTDFDVAYSVVEDIANTLDPDGTYRAGITARKYIKLSIVILIIAAVIIFVLYWIRRMYRKKGAVNMKKHHPIIIAICIWLCVAICLILFNYFIFGRHVDSPTISLHSALLIHESMPIDTVKSLLFGSGDDVGSGTIIHKYRMYTGSNLIVNYAIDSESVFRVYKVYMEDPWRTVLFYDVLVVVAIAEFLIYRKVRKNIA